jgi:MFS family permease
MRRTVFLGWWVVAGLFVINMMTSGLGFYAQSPYLKSLVNAQGFSNTLTSVGTGLFFLVSGLMGYFTAALISRFDVRYLMAVGGVLGGVGLALLGQVHSEWQLFAANAFFGVGFAFCGLVPANTVVTRWFHRRRALAISVSSTGLSAGGIIITRQLAGVIDTHGMPSVTPWLGLLWALVIVPTALFVVKPSPQARGLLPDGETAPVTAATTMPGAAPEPTPREVTSAAPHREVLPSHTFAEARRTRFFRFMTLSYVFIMLAQVGALAHQNKLGSDRVSNAVGALAVSVTAGASVFGRLAGGFVVLRVPSRWLTAALIGLQCVSLTLLAGADTKPAILLASLVFGLSVGNLLMLQPLLIAEAFGVGEYAKVYGSSQVVTTLGVAAGPIMLGFLQDHFDYQVAYSTAAVASVLALVLFVTAGPVRSATAVVRARPTVTAATTVAAAT